MPRMKSLAFGIVSSPDWKALAVRLIAGLYMSGFVAISRWWGRMMFNNSHSFHPFVPSDFLPGIGFLLIAFWSWWTSHPRRKNKRWHEWLILLVFLMYITGLFLWGAISLFNHSLNYPWNQVVNGVVVALFTLVWIMPLLSYPTAKKLSQIPWLLSGPMMGLVGIAGTLGASFGMYGYRHGETKLVFGVMGFLCLFVAFLMAMSGARSIWDSRPWAREGEE